MANYHIMSGSGDGNSFTVVAHYPVPNVNNDVGVNYRAALIQYLGGTQPSMCPFITGDEQTEMNSGAIYERSYTFHTNPNETPAQKTTKLDALYGVEKTRVLAELAKLLSYWGFSHDVP